MNGETPVGAIVSVDAQNFQAEVLEKSQQVPVLVEFYAEGAEQCAATSALLARLASEYQGKFVLARVEVQSNAQLVQQLQVRALPTVKIIFQGQLAGDIPGPPEEEQLRGALDQLTMSPMERIRDQIDFLIAQGERGQAIQMLQQVIAEEPQNFALHVELSDLLIMEGQVDDARKIVDALPADTDGIGKPKARLGFIDLAGDLPKLDALQQQAAGGELQDLFNLAIGLVVDDQVEPALDVLLEMLKKDKTWQEELARKTMIQVFDMLGKGDETATRYRRKMFTFLH